MSRNRIASKMRKTDKMTWVAHALQPANQFSLRALKPKGPRHQKKK